MSTDGRSACALVVGVGSYHSANVTPLPCAVRDAGAFASALMDPDICGFPAERVKLLTDGDASRAALAKHLHHWLPEHARGVDIAVVYFAGHGLLARLGRKEQGYLLPFDANPEDIVSDGISMADFSSAIDGIDARAIVMCLDCCHAGSVMTRRTVTRGASVLRGLGPAAFDAIAGRGRFIISACDEGEESIESADIGHGLFTYHLLHGLQGAADQDGDGKVGVAELFEFVSGAVKRDAQERYRFKQTPWFNSMGTAGTYLAVPRVGTEPRQAPPGQAGPEPGGDPLAELAARIKDADEQTLIALLMRLRGVHEPRVLPYVFHCLAHKSPRVRELARKLALARGWPAVAAVIGELAYKASEVELEYLLDGLGAFEAHAEVVQVLDRLVSSLSGNLRHRAIRALDKKRLRLEQDRVAALFQEIRSPYAIQKALGQGLFTASYLARDQTTELDVVVRLLRPELAVQAEARAQFLDVSRRASRWVHENLVMTREVREFGDKNIYYAVRDYIDGITLQEVLESGKAFEPIQVVKILEQLVGGLRPAHRARAFHGGLKPSNIFVCSADRIILGDASQPPRNVVVPWMRSSYDHRYIAPEAFGAGVPGSASDFYALGCVAHELFCGRPPFESDSPFELIAKHLKDAPPPLQTGVPVQRFVLKLLQKRPEDRFPDTDTVLAGLAELKARLSPQPAGQTAWTPLLEVSSLSDLRPQESVVGFSPDQTFGGTLATPELGGDELELGAAPERPVLAAALPGAIGKYQPTQLLGKGAMGAVYLANDPVLERTVAVKVMRPDVASEEELRRRFQREASSAARLNHPNIVTIYDFGEEGEQLYIAMEYIDGPSLTDVLREGPMDPVPAARLFATLAQAIHYAHSKGLVHRDLKPGNVALTRSGVPKVLDFGIAMRASDSMTQPGVLMGTPSYMAPEQIRGERLDARSDVFALGVMLYEALTGTRPFKADSVHALMFQIMNDQPPPPRQLRPSLPPSLETVCLKCLAKDPDDRFASAEELARALHRIVERSGGGG